MASGKLLFDVASIFLMYLQCSEGEPFVQPKQDSTGHYLIYSQSAQPKRGPDYKASDSYLPQSSAVEYFPSFATETAYPGDSHRSHIWQPQTVSRYTEHDWESNLSALISTEGSTSVPSQLKISAYSERTSHPISNLNQYQRGLIPGKLPPYSLHDSRRNPLVEIIAVSDPTLLTTDAFHDSSNNMSHYDSVSLVYPSIPSNLSVKAYPEHFSKRRGASSERKGSVTESWEKLSEWVEDYQRRSENGSRFPSQRNETEILSSKASSGEEGGDKQSNELETDIDNELQQLPYEYETRALTLALIFEIPIALLIPLFVLKPFMREKRSIQLEHQLTQSYDQPFYASNLQIIDLYMEVLGIGSESCKMRILCQLSNRPNDYSPFSDIIIEQLRTNSPVEEKLENRYYRYMLSTQLESSGNVTGCLDSYKCQYSMDELVLRPSLQLWKIVAETFKISPL